MFICVLLPSGVMSGCVEHGLYCCPREKGGVIWQRFSCHYWFAAREPDSYRVLGHECAEFFAVLISILKKKIQITHVMSGQLEEITAQFSPQSRIRPSGGHISNQAVIITGTGLTKLSSAWERGVFMISASTSYKAWRVTYHKYCEHAILPAEPYPSAGHSKNPLLPLNIVDKCPGGSLRQALLRWWLEDELVVQDRMNLQSANSIWAAL